MPEQPQLSIRPLEKGDQSFLWDIIYYAIYIPEGEPRLPRSIVEVPEIAKYARSWGREGDIGFVATQPDNNRPVGAAWIRLFERTSPGYGFVDEQTPELTIALLPAWRGRGIGEQLLRHLLQQAKSRYQAVSLNVAEANPALRLYKRLGFQVVRRQHEEYLIMKINLTGKDFLPRPIE